MMALAPVTYSGYAKIWPWLLKRGGDKTCLEVLILMVKTPPLSFLVLAVWKVG